MENETKGSDLGADSAGYEMLDRYNPVYEEIKAMQPLNLPDQQGLPPSSAGPDYHIIQCPAYVTVAQENQQAEISSIQPAGTTAARDSSEMSSNNQDGDLDNAEDNETGM